MDYSFSYQMTDISDMLQKYTVFGLIFTVLLIIAMWRIFEKAGEAGWKSIIPIYNAYILWKIAGLNFLKFFLTVFIAGILVGIFAANGLGILTFITYIALIVYCFVMVWKLYKNLSLSFGHGTGFALGLFFFTPIFLLILGFNGDTYNKVA